MNATSQHEIGGLGLPRRELLRRAGMGLGLLGAASLLAAETPAAKAVAPGGGPPLDLSVRPPHFAPRARAVIHIFANGGPSHLDTFDPKPALATYAGRELPAGSLKTERRTGAALPSP